MNLENFAFHYKPMYVSACIWVCEHQFLTCKLYPDELKNIAFHYKPVCVSVHVYGCVYINFLLVAIPICRHEFNKHYKIHYFHLLTWTLVCFLPQESGTFFNLCIYTDKYCVCIIIYFFTSHVFIQMNLAHFVTFLYLCTHVVTISVYFVCTYKIFKLLIRFIWNLFHRLKIKQNKSRDKKEKKKKNWYITPSKCSQNSTNEMKHKHKKKHGKEKRRTGIAHSHMYHWTWYNLMLATAQC